MDPLRRKQFCPACDLELQPSIIGPVCPDCDGDVIDQNGKYTYEGPHPSSSTL